MTVPNGPSVGTAPNPTFYNSLNMRLMVTGERGNHIWLEPGEKIQGDRYKAFIKAGLKVCAPDFQPPNSAAALRARKALPAKAGARRGPVAGEPAVRPEPAPAPAPAPARAAPAPAPARAVAAPATAVAAPAPAAASTPSRRAVSIEDNLGSIGEALNVASLQPPEGVTAKSADALLAEMTDQGGASANQAVG